MGELPELNPGIEYRMGWLIQNVFFGKTIGPLEEVMMRQIRRVSPARRRFAGPGEIPSRLMLIADGPSKVREAMRGGMQPPYRLRRPGGDRWDCLPPASKHANRLGVPGGRIAKRSQEGRQ
jgi:hypothetical protein